MTGTVIRSRPSGLFCAWVSTCSASCKRFSGSWHWLKYSRPCAVNVTRRVVRLRRDTPSFDSSTDNRRLTVEIGIPNERAARVMLSNWATLTNIRTSSRAAIENSPIFGNLIQEFPTLSVAVRSPTMRSSKWVIGTQDQDSQAKVEDSHGYETEDHHCDGSLSGNRGRDW